MLALVLTLSILSALIFGLNIYCIIPILRSPKLRRPSHIAICSLLYAHITQALFVIPTYAIKKAGTVESKLVCDIFRLSYLFTNYVACLSLLLITLDRVYGVLHPLRYAVVITSSKMLKCVVFIWIYAFLLCLIPFDPRGTSKSCNYVPQKEWTVFMLMFNTLLPFIIIFISYIIIFKKANKILKERRKTTRCKKLQRNTQVHFNKSKITVIIVACFVFCWGPGFVYYFIQAVCELCISESFKNSKAEDAVTFTMKLLTFIDGVIAPLIYCFMNAKFNVERRKQWVTIKKYSRRHKFDATVHSESNTDIYSVSDNAENISKTEEQVFHVTLDRRLADLQPLVSQSVTPEPNLKHSETYNILPHVNSQSLEDGLDTFCNSHGHRKSCIF